MDIHYFETSSQLNYNINEVFEYLTKQILNPNKIKNNSPIIGIKDEYDNRTNEVNQLKSKIEEMQKESP